ncbi:transporter [Candidatus Thiodictyon syntrophicum]|uniref:transporter n=1 Tax=Candidatus Thiodictyon syntrophicum TaxID=1166950 RepID=UPI00202AE1E5|nr:transporter [Candidatus Thiodictyon syntrophicum]
MLGDFKGRTAGLGPVLGYVLPLGKQNFVTELRWLRELDTRNRLAGDYVWLKLVYQS